MTNIDNTLNEFMGSKYFISATGMRGVGFDELKSIFLILFDGENVKHRLDTLYKGHPDTIQMDMAWRKMNCESFVDECDCFLPGVEFENCYCQAQKKKRIETADKRNYPEYQLWRTSVFERDNYTCQKCGSRGGTLNAHHIKSYKNYPELRVDVSNGITLCELCHRKEHSKNKAD